MDDALYGKRDKRGDWKPNKALAYPPVFVWPVQPLGFLRWLLGPGGYILSWNLLYAAVGILLWLYATPSMDTMRTLSPGWIAFLFARNALLTLVFFGAFHLRLYVQRRQGTSFKFNGKWPAKEPNSDFLFGSQNLDNMIWTFASAVPVWTAFEALTLWAFANGVIPTVDFAEHPVYCVALMLAIPLIRELHFYAVHRLIHVPLLYRTVHKLHHNNVNPGPWSGLAMHPVEHLLYFSVIFVHWVVPSNPIHAIFTITHTGLAPAPGHAGFDKVVLSDGAAIDTHCYDHYLHHKYFECNYADGAVPLDKWFGTFHDGTKASQERMDERFLAAARRSQEKQARRAARQAG